MIRRFTPHASRRPLAFAAASIALLACGSSSSDNTFHTANGASDGGASADGGAPGTFDFDAGGGGHASDGGGGGSDVLMAVIRDFRLYNAGNASTNPDFENVPKTDQNGNPNSGYTGPWDDLAIVTDTLGADGKPVYASSGVTLTTHGKSAFDQWYRDVSGTNIHVEIPIPLTVAADGSSSFDSEKTGVPLSASDPQKMFFPIDDGTQYATAFGNEGDPHNYSFTVELHTTFTYKGGEFFNFRGDDDVFVYVNQKRVINLGGIHGPETAQIDVDTLGLTKGQDYPLDFFSAERHKTGSNILFTTTLGLRSVPPR